MEKMMKEKLSAMKACAPMMASALPETRNRALSLIGKALGEQWDRITEANRLDLERAREKEISPAVLKRLAFGPEKREACLKGIEDLMGMEEFVGKCLFRRSLDEGLVLEKRSCPIGVIGVIFEARPDAMVQIACLCIKSGNCAVLKGGKETAETNKALFELIHEAATEAGLPREALLQASSHEEIDELLAFDEFVDLLIPRGSNAFVRHIMDNTRIPVMGHADGICHIYVDNEADAEKAIPLILDAKTQYPAVCNALETLLLHKDLMESFYPRLKKALEEAGVKLNGPYSSDEASDAVFKREYLALELTIGIVEDLDQAISHINRYGSHHTDCILTENRERAERFISLVDSAGVYVNASTRFADGYRYGFGAEVGISTGKLHARGPVGVEGLLTYKYVLRGSGQRVADYAEGKKDFHFRELPPE